MRSWEKKSPRSSKSWEATATRERATPIWPLVAPAIRRSRVPSCRRTAPAVSTGSRLEPSISRRGAGAVEGRERGVGLARSTPRRLYPELDDAEEALDDPLHRVHGLDVIQGYRPLVFLDNSPPQAEGAAGNLVGGSPPREEAPEGREHRHDEGPQQDQDEGSSAKAPARQECDPGDDERAQGAPDGLYGGDEHRRRVEVVRLRAHPAPG